MRRLVHQGDNTQYCPITCNITQNTWFTKVTNILALSSLRQLVAYRQMHHVRLRIDKRFYSSR